MHDRRLRPLALLVLAVAGCGPVATTVHGTFIYFGGATMPPGTLATPPEQVGVFTDEVPERSFFEIGLIEAMGFGTQVKETELIPELRRQASLMGGDAIYRLEMQRFDESGGALYATAVAVRYR